MGLFSKLFSSPSSRVEKELEEQYVHMFQTTAGMPASHARSTVRDMLYEAKSDSRKEGSINLPQNFGDMLLEKEPGSEEIQARFAKKRNEGVTDNDIRWWWNMHDLERRVLLKVDDLFRLAQFTKLMEEDGLDEEQAMKEVRKFQPMYGDPDDTSHTTGDDRPLPVELKDRINRYIEKEAQTDADRYKREIENYSSFNALVRNEIKRGTL